MAEDREREWLRPERIAENGSGGHGFGQTAPQAGTAPMFELRPLSLGELLDRTFSLYRSRFWMFAAISAVSASVQVIVQAVSLASTHTLIRNVAVSGPAAAPGVALRGMATAQIETAIAGLLFFLVATITQAATSLALSEVYLSQPANAKQALGVAAKRWLRWIGIGLWQLGSMLWVPVLALLPGGVLLLVGARQGSAVLTGLGGALMLLVLPGFVVGFILYLRNTLATPAAVVEGLTVRAAMRRSKVLAAGTKGRIFVVLLIAGCLYGVVGVLESPATLLILFAPKQQHTLAQAITLLISFAGRTVVQPVALIGLTLLYFDQRVRKEAFDLQLLLEGSRGAALAGANTAARPTTPEGFAPLG